MVDSLDLKPILLCYYRDNRQGGAALDQIIVACDVVQECNDFSQLRAMVELCEANLYEISEEPDKMLADAGYCSEVNLEYLEPGAPRCQRRP
ncbi:MAG: hypothetical protein FD177_1366 [Desulfovibrionaceae bacterium]|nr:MAG: hypothetical protein FD177_1366 [Desulfovibrionaceae bacterium]